MMWHAPVKEVWLASVRMFLQLLLMGYVLVYLFESSSLLLSIAVLAAMLLVATWIALRPVKQYDGLLIPGITALGCAVIFHLFITMGLVLQVQPWYQPNILIPLAGMYYANSMNAISLATERFYSEIKHHTDIETARGLAFKAAMLPQINGLLAVGLVALPGMMTGQILSGVSPLIAVRYQILIMTMVLGASGVGAALMLLFITKKRLNLD